MKLSLIVICAIFVAHFVACAPLNDGACHGGHSSTSLAEKPEASSWTIYLWSVQTLTLSMIPITTKFKAKASPLWQTQFIWVFMHSGTFASLLEALNKAHNSGMRLISAIVMAVGKSSDRYPHQGFCNSGFSKVW
ncbi:hypothetical protein C8J56DRAFT_896104 [Mycena floridula]|nr:hypothetical protein C8J56DRAFT_896104 [Mycena floridula]